MIHIALLALLITADPSDQAPLTTTRAAPGDVSDVGSGVGAGDVAGQGAPAPPTTTTTTTMTRGADASVVARVPGAAAVAAGPGPLSPMTAAVTGAVGGVLGVLALPLAAIALYGIAIGNGSSALETLAVVLSVPLLDAVAVAGVLWFLDYPPADAGFVGFGAGAGLLVGVVGGAVVATTVLTRTGGGPAVVIALPLAVAGGAVLGSAAGAGLAGLGREKARTAAATTE